MQIGGQKEHLGSVVCKIYLCSLKCSNSGRKFSIKFGAGKYRK